MICILANIKYAKLLNLYSHCYLIKQVKGLSKEDLATREDLVFALPERIQAIPDGITTAAKQTGGWAASTSHKNIKFDSSGDQCFYYLSRVTIFNDFEHFNLLLILYLFHYHP